MTHVSSSAPILLGAASATPPSRTPWGGHRIAARKAAPGGGSGAEPGGIVGESWEISLDPDFPSRTLDGVPLADVLRADPAHYLGREARVGRTGTALLLKWLDAAERLSLQIHPRDGDPALAPLESGKPEAWYVVERTPGAGLYIGYRVGVGESEIRHAIDAGNSLEPLLQFVAVEPGDFFVIEAGTPHAIGEGVFVVEPQHVVPGRHGVTYRYWDWGRRYDKAGRASADGAPRELHLEAALRVTDWSCAGADWLAGVRFRAGRAALGGAMCVEPLGGPGAPVSSDHLAVWRVAGTGEAALPETDTLRGITLLEGEVEVENAGGAVRLVAGQTAVVPAAAQSVRIQGRGAHGVLASVVVVDGRP